MTKTIPKRELISETNHEDNNNSRQRKWPSKRLSSEEIPFTPNRTTNSLEAPATLSVVMQPRQATKGQQTAIGQKQQQGTKQKFASTAHSMDASRRGPSAGKSALKQEQQPKLIKKAFVRFDDYLELNEEDMRLSCKRLMNHLYSEPNASLAPASTPLVVLAPAISCQSVASAATMTPVTATKGEGQSVLPTTTRIFALIGDECVAASNRTSNLAPQQQPTLPQQNRPTSTTASASGKSYLQSQYERRQLRQLQQLDKVEQKKVKMSEQVNVGASSIKELDQQDLVERSHELSKRRFFEKLERRESIKNLNLNSTQNTCSRLKRQATAATSASAHADDQERKHLNQEACKQKRTAATTAAAATTTVASNYANEDELPFKVYQSIATKGDQSEGQSGQEAKNDTLGRLNGAQAAVSATCCDSEELVGELIGFYTPSLRSPAAGEQEGLIEISGERHSQQSEGGEEGEEYHSKDASATLVAESGGGRSDYNSQSAFEIKVPPSSAFFNSQNQATDGFIGSGLLVVKQLEQLATERDLFLQVTDAGGLPVVSSRLSDGSAAKAGATQLAGNKTKTPPLPPLVDSTTITENSSNMAFRSAPAEQINGEMTDAKTMESIRMPTTAAAAIANQSKRSASSAESTDSDNKHQTVGISSTISCGNNNTEMGTISSVEAEDTTGKVKSGILERSAGEVIEQPVSIELSGGGGESNHAKDHDAPETRIIVGQQLGGTEGDCIAADGHVNASAAANTAAATIANSNSAYSVRAQSNAQVVSHSQTKITKAEIRDVLPEATAEINRFETIVSIEKSSAEKVTSIAEPADEVQQQQKQRIESQHEHEHFTFKNSEYANPIMLAGANEMRADNVNHNGAGGAKKIADAAKEKPDLMGGEAHLVDSLAKRSKSIQKKSGTSSSLEEDGSSCSSSGFGASVSVTGSSSDGSASMSVAGTKHELGKSLSKRSTLQANNKCNARTDPDCDPIYDSVRVSYWSRSQMALEQEFLDCKQLVGPDQAYPRKMTLVENHCYASVLNRSDSNALDQRITITSGERDFNSSGGYANLPIKNKTVSLVDYAPIHPIIDNGNFSNKGRLQNSLSDTSLSNHSYSTSTANSGGFSALPPAQVECSAANNSESFVSLADVPQRKSSLLKRFGSLVSRAFSSTATATTQSATLKINEPSAVNCSQQQQFWKSSINNNNNHASKATLVIEKNRQVVVVEQAQERAQLDEVDLVILPTKHVNQRAQPLPQQIQLPAEKDPTVLLRHDDRLSREKKHSRKVKHTHSASTTSSSSSSSYSSSLSSSEASDHQHRIERPKRADSFSNELESLVSRSECSTNYRTQESKSLRKRASSSSNKNKQPKKSTGSRRIDIDCVPPTKNTDRRSQIFDVKSNGPRSLLRLFSSSSSSSSQRATAIESTPNLTNSLVQLNRRPSTQLVVGDNNYTSDYVVDGRRQQQQPTSGFWGLSSLIVNNHASRTEASTTNDITTCKGSNRKSRTNACSKSDADDRDYLKYASLQPDAAGYRLHPSSAIPREQEQQQRQILEKYQPPGLYQNLLRNYTKSRHRHHHGHGHSHGHHNHHYHYRAHQHSSHRHAHRSARCGQNNCNLSSSSASLSYGSNEKVVVWGQLIKINKSDGSQVIELQRKPGKPWGFFVARGAINNTKGVFISRMHDNVTSNSLTGLLSIGDRILAIDECPIEPDYDILRVNQLISQKSKILLTVKPFKG